MYLYKTAGVKIIGLNVDEGGKFGMMRVKSSLKPDAWAPFNPSCQFKHFPNPYIFM
jgi:hypothetical protein